MANRLLELFDLQNISGSGYVATQPQSLAQMMASGAADSGSLQPMLDITSRVRPKVDYSDFGNFVFFNSALDYFNISGERMINDWPYDGMYSDQLNFQSASDDYQDWLLGDWPLFSGSMLLVSGAHVNVSGNALVSGSVVTNYLALNTGSWTWEMRVSASSWASSATLFQLNISGTTSVLAQLSTNTASLTITDVSGVTRTLVGTGSFPIDGMYLAWTLERLTPSTLNWTLNVTDFTNTTPPYFVSGGVTASSYFPNGTGTFQVGGSSTFAVSEVRVWNDAQTYADLVANYNTRVYAQDGLALYWRFAEGLNGVLVKDYSGHKMNGGILTGTAGTYSWRSGGFGMSPQDTGEYVLNVAEPVLRSFITSTQYAGADGSGTLVSPHKPSAAWYDRNNTGIITSLVPQQFFFLEDEQNTTVLKDLLYILARQFDQMKVAIDQFPKVLLPSYTGFDEAPDALLGDVLKFWGWDTKGNFLSNTAFQYFFGYSVLSGAQGTYDNQRLDTQLFEIKSEFWHRTLQNLAYIYKKKGTREAVEALFRVYGLDDKIIKLKEYGLQPMVGIQTRRIGSNKSATYISLSGTQSIKTIPAALSNLDPSASIAVNMQVMFPPRTVLSGTVLVSGVLVPVYEPGFTLTTGSLFSFKKQGTLSGMAQQMSFPLGAPITTLPDEIEEIRYGRRPSGTKDLSTGQYIDTTGSLWLTVSVNGTASTSPSVIWSNVPIFDGEWYSLTVTRENPDPGYIGTLPAAAYELTIQQLDPNDPTVANVVYDASGTDTPIPVPIDLGNFEFILGTVPSSAPWVANSGSEFSAFNVQVWNLDQSITEIQDHTLNPFSYGADTPARFQELMLNWQFDQGKDAYASLPSGSNPGENPSGYGESVAHNSAQTGPLGTGFLLNSGTYIRDEFDYNYIAPIEYGWNEEKIRYLEGPVADAVDAKGFVTAGSKVTVTSQEDMWDESNVVALEFNLMDALNEDISYMLSSMTNWNNIIGEAVNRYREDYPQLQQLRAQYFNRLTGRINFRAFADFLDFFDRSFVELVQKLLPARSNFKGAEFIVESHMLERPKVQFTYRLQDVELAPEGDITIYSSNYKAVSSLAPQVFISGSASFTASSSATYYATIQFIGGSGTAQTTPVAWSLSGSGTLVATGLSATLFPTGTGPVVITADPAGYPQVSASKVVTIF